MNLDILANGAPPPWRRKNDGKDSEKGSGPLNDKKYLHVGESIFTFKTTGNIVKYGLEYGHNDISYPFAYDQTNIYYMQHQKYVPIDQYKKSTYKSEYDYLHRNNKVNGKKLQNYELIHE